LNTEASSVSPDPLAVNGELSQWLRSPFGSHVRTLELEALKTLLPDTAGYRGMALQIVDNSPVLDGAPQLHKFAIASCDQQSVAAISDFYALPLPSSVVDMVVLDHVLDYCELPHESLKEAARVVLPSGHMVIVGFNPVSSFGLARWLMGCFSRRLIWRCRGLSVPRIVDWLRLVGFQCEKVVYGAYNMPIQSRRFLARMKFVEEGAKKLHLPVGAFYVIVAKKQRLRPISGRRDWLAKAIKPVTLIPDTKIEPRKNGSRHG
jgi:SAM-dependent methyltransferase